MNRNTDHPLREAIEEFRESQLHVYKSQPGRLRRDASSAKEVIRDHVGRWPYELVQNAEDALATSVVIHFAGNTIYFADNGCGLPSRAVESLSGTHFSEKPPTSIGRKGLGFKAVYCVSPSPAVFCGSDGILFDRECAIVWMRQNDLDTKHVPFQWLPFWKSRDEEEQSDPALRDLQAFRTVVRLTAPSAELVASAWALLQEFSGQTLLTFSSLRQLKVRSESGRGFHIYIDLDKEGGVTTIRDDREQSPIPWLTVRTALDAPGDLLATFEEGDDRERARHVSLLAAAPIGPDGVCNPLSEVPNLYVYYPTEEPSPIRVLLHGDFLIKSDRTGVVPLAETPYNQWVGRELSQLLIRFVLRCYRATAPSTYLRLLVPTSEMSSRSNSRQLWKFIQEAATNSLRLPDSEGVLNLRVSEALRLALDENKSSARTIISVSKCARFLVHPTFDDDDEADQALMALDVSPLGESEVVNCIRKHAAEKSADKTWLWACWTWLADWVGDSKEHLQIIGDLPLIPCGNVVVSGEQAAHMTVTWESSELRDKYPDWIPIRFIDNSFRDGLLEHEKDSPLQKLAANMRIVAPEVGTVLRAVAQAAKEFWEKEIGDPSRFLKVLVEQRWYESQLRPANLDNCPVPCRYGKESATVWRPARDAYLGNEWGDRSLAELYRGVQEVHWVRANLKLVDKATMRVLLEWLDVKAYPWVVFDGDDGAADWRERSRIGRYLRNYTAIDRIEPPTSLEYVEPATLASEKASYLLLLLSKNWDRYYKSKAQSRVRYQYYSWYTTTVPARWWETLRSELKPPLCWGWRATVPLERCWLNSDHLRRLAPLLPCIDLRDLPKRERAQVVTWLRSEIKLRERPEQLDDSEIANIIRDRIPAMVPEATCTDRTRRDQVSHWYADLLEVYRGRKQNRPNLSGMPLLCSRNEEWKYVADEPIWLDDDHDASSAFRGLIWTISLRRELRKVAQEVLGIRSLVGEKHVVPQWSALDRTGVDEQPLIRMKSLLQDVKAFIFAWMSHSRFDQSVTDLRDLIRSLHLRYVRDLQLSVRLDAVQEARSVRRSYAVDGSALILDVERMTESSLAKALAEALQVAEADFFEILLRCPDHAARRRKLSEDRNVGGDELDRYLTEWHEGEPQTSIVWERDSQTESERAREDGQASGSELRQASEVTTAAAMRDAQLASQQMKSLRESKDEHVGRTRRQLVLKKPSEANLVVQTAAEVQASRGSMTGGSGSPSTSPQEMLSDDDRKQVETVSREVAEIYLRRLGFTVQQMPFDNPGFDIRATKGGSPILLIEVKGHVGRATHIDLTAREYGEYARCLGSTCEMWELWNIEQLSENLPKEVLLSRYRGIPDHALVGVRGFRVNLQACAKVADARDS